MKKTILALTLTGVLVSHVSAQGVGNQVETKEVRGAIVKLLADVESARNKPVTLNRAIRKLGAQLRNNRNQKVYMNPSTISGVTEKLVKVFNSIDNQGTNGANKLRIIEVIGFSDNGPLAKEFFLGLIGEGEEKHREMALWSLSPKGVHGEEIYQKIQDITKRGMLKEADAFASLQRANAAKALPEIKRFLATTKDVRHFVKVGILLCDYQDPSLIDVLIERQGDFAVSAPKTSGDAIAQQEPVEAINSKILRKYIEISDDNNLAKALKVLKKKGITSEADISLFEKKLSSSNVETRRVVVRFLDEQASENSGFGARIKPVISKVLANETDEKLKVQLRGVIDRAEKNKAKR